LLFSGQTLPQRGEHHYCARKRADKLSHLVDVRASEFRERLAFCENKFCLEIAIVHTLAEQSEINLNLLTVFGRNETEQRSRCSIQQTTEKAMG
jgi:hypothetical protein